MTKKLIVPAELKVCATCSYWDGERKVDPELRVVIVDDCSEGLCLVKCKSRQGLTNESEWHDDCLWEHLAPDSPNDEEEGS